MLGSGSGSGDHPVRTRIRGVAVLECFLLTFIEIRRVVRYRAVG